MVAALDAAAAVCAADAGLALLSAVTAAAVAGLNAAAVARFDFVVLQLLLLMWLCGVIRFCSLVLLLPADWGWGCFTCRASMMLLY